MARFKIELFGDSNIGHKSALNSIKLVEMNLIQKYHFSKNEKRPMGLFY